MGTIRFSVGRMTTREEIAIAVEETSKIITRLMPNSAPAAEDHQASEVKLTQFTHGMGCACKIRPQLLEQVLTEMPVPQDARILVGTETGDDAAVFLINEETALVQTVDFFTPIVDDPYTFGAISAANSLSDVYAMGAKPLFALSVVGFPSNRLPMDVLKAILRGANDKAAEAGIAIIGGHTVDDTEPKFGLAVTGQVHPKQIITNAAAQPGDRLVLTKPIGTGILTSARKQGLIGLDEIRVAVKAMAELNDIPSQIMQETGAHSCTDVTGFGLLGHLLGMMKASGTTAQVQALDVPFFEVVRDLAAGGSVPGGTKDNMAFTEPFTEYHASIPLSIRYILNDAQTSGGLIVSLSAAAAEEFIKKMMAAGRPAWLIGTVSHKAERFIQVF
jgi:selenium donor protein